MEESRVLRNYFLGNSRKSFNGLRYSLKRIIRSDPDNPDKYGIGINLVCRPFDDIIPADNHWVKISLAGLNAEWVEVDELIEKLK